VSGDRGVADGTAPSAPRRSRVGVRGQIFGWYVLLLVLAAGASLFVQHRFLTAQADRTLREELNEEIREFELRLKQGSDPVAQEPWPDVRSVFDSYLRRTVPEIGEAFVTFVSGRLHRDAQGLTQLPDIRPLVARWRMLRRSQSGRIDTSRGSMRYRAIPVRHRGQEGVMVVTILSERETDPIAEAMQLGATIWISIVAVASLLAWRLAGYLLRPVDDLILIAEEINESDFSRRIPVRSSDEIGRLTATFNRMLDRLEAAFASQREFIDTTGHELRTPLTVARGYLELLRDEPSDLEETVDVVTEELDRMTRLVNDLLVLARSEQPDFLEFQDVDVADLTCRAFDKMRTLGDRDWRLRQACRGTVRADVQRLTQVLLILADNAVQYSERGSLIEVGCEQGDGHARLWIADHGPGISSEDRERIFATYGRAPGNRGRRESLGLGLSIARRIADGHRGRIDVDPTYSKGARFVVTIPLASRGARGRAPIRT